MPAILEMSHEYREYIAEITAHRLTSMRAIYKPSCRRDNYDGWHQTHAVRNDIVKYLMIWFNILDRHFVN